jgi:cell division inhibitor SepF
MAFNIKGIFGKEDGEEELEEVEEFSEGGVTQTPYSNEKTIKLLEPRAYSESQQIADYLKKKTSVIVNLKRVTPDQGKRIVDFLSGTLYAIEGDLQKLGGGIFLCTPHGMNVDGIFSDDNQKGQAKGADKSQKDDKDEDEFNW